MERRPSLDLADMAKPGGTDRPGLLLCRVQQRDRFRPARLSQARPLKRFVILPAFVPVQPSRAAISSRTLRLPAAWSRSKNASPSYQCGEERLR
jgi:hypothetical protein